MQQFRQEPNGCAQEKQNNHADDYHTASSAGYAEGNDAQKPENKPQHGRSR